MKAMLVGVMLTAATTTTLAGGILTNTNQSIDFLRNPSRDAAIGLDGVYSNPAGVAFMPEGFHLGFNWQYAHQTRTITSDSPAFALGRKNDGSTRKVFEGVADAPFIPSLQAAYNTGNWSIQFNFSVPGGGGACEYSDGLGSFESVVGGIAGSFITLDGMASRLNGLTQQLTPVYTMLGQAAPDAISNTDVVGYDMDGYMEGRQYYFGFQLGSAYKINEHLSVYGGLRLLYGTATYRAKISNIMVRTGNAYEDFGSFLPKVPVQALQNATVAQQHLGIINQLEQAQGGLSPELAEAKKALVSGLASLQESQGQLATLSKYSEGVNLLCNQTSVGVAPIISIDYKLNDHFNFAAKYEFKTQIRMKNESTVNEASEIAAVNKFRDGENVNEDMPALLTVGAMWSPIEVIRINGGWHHYFDKSARWYNNAQQLLRHDSNEFLLGGEWDVNDRFTVSIGGQLTRYGLSDEYMNDMSFVTNSYSIGFGANYKANQYITLKAGYFQTDYDDYNRTDYPPLSGQNDSFTRTNRVIGLGIEVSL